MNTQIFNYQSKEVRTVMLDGEPWFVGVDVCKVLGLTNPSESLKALDNDERSTLRISEGGPEVNIINEPGLYALIIRSNKPEAKQFKRWITRLTQKVIDTLEESMAKTDQKEIEALEKRLFQKKG